MGVPQRKHNTVLARIKTKRKLDILVVERRNAELHAFLVGLFSEVLAPFRAVENTWVSPGTAPRTFEVKSLDHNAPPFQKEYGTFVNPRYLLIALRKSGYRHIRVWWGRGFRLVEMSTQYSVPWLALRPGFRYASRVQNLPEWSSHSIHTFTC